MSIDTSSANGAGSEEPLEKQIAGLAGTIVAVLHKLRVLQFEMEKQHGSKAGLNILKYAAAHMRKALGDEKMMGLLDFAGVQQVRGWLDQAVLDGHYLSQSQGESYDIYRFDASHNVLYSSPALNIDDTSFWHQSTDAVILHLTVALGVPPDGTYQFIPLKARGT